MLDNQNPDEVKDQNVLAFMIQLVQEKFSDDVDAEFLNQEANRLYDLFGNNLVSYFEPMLTEEQKQSFDQLVEQASDQDVLLNFLVENIPNLEQQILQVLVAFRANYLELNTQENTEGNSNQ